MDRNRVGVRALRTSLADAVRRAADGERVVVTLGGRDVAQLGPIEPPAAHVTLDLLVAGGQVVPPARTDPAPEPPQIPMWAGLRIDSLLREVRGR